MKMKIVLTGFLFCSLITFCFVACDVPNPAIESPVEIAYTEICQKENRGKFVTVKGYLALKNTFFINEKDGHETTDDVLLVSKPFGENGIDLKMLVGSGINMIKPPPFMYSRGDLQVHTTDEFVGPSDLVKVTGTITVYDWKCSIEVKAIAAVTEPQTQNNVNTQTNKPLEKKSKKRR